MTTSLIRRRAVPTVVLALAALLAGLLALAIPHHDADAAVAGHGGSHGEVLTPRTAAAADFQDQMRKLWEDHVTWTRLAIVTFVDGSPGTSASVERLLANQVDIGDAIKPFYGDAAGDQLTALLHDHITIAVELLQAAKAGDNDAFNDANARWYANANDIAAFLASANPKSWPEDEMRDSMNTHLKQTLAEASHELTGKAKADAGDTDAAATAYAASVADYDEIHDHILEMADVLSSGIIKAFPSDFR